MVVWPFLSAFPAISLIGVSTFDFTTSLNIVFLVTGFWTFAGVTLVFLWLLRREARSQIRLLFGSDKGLMLGAYATLWIILYIIAAIANR